VQFFQQHIAGDLAGQNVPDILQVDAIKYVYVFRTQLGTGLWHAAFPCLVQRLGSQNYVVHTYAAIAVERALFMTDENKQPLIPKADVVPLSKDLLQHLFKLIVKNPAPEKIQENEFLMKCVMRVLIFIRENIAPITELVLHNFIGITKVIRHNPSNPRFQYFLFEGIGALIRFTPHEQHQKLETALFEPFFEILQGDVQEFVPYIFQLFAALLEANPGQELGDMYKTLLNPIIMPVLWEARGNVPALARLLCAIIARDSAGIVARNQLEPILGIFQKLISSKANEVHAFELLETIIANVPVAELQKYFTTIIQLMLTRLSNAKTENFTQRFIAFYHFISARQEKGLGADFFIQATDQVQHE